MASIPDYIIKNFNEGIITRVEDESLPKGAADGATYNWLNLGDHIELRRGQAVLGTAVQGAGRVTGLEVARKLDPSTSNEVIMSTYNRKLRYLDPAGTADWVEVNTDQFPAAANGEDIAIEKYYSLAGAFFYISSPNSGVYKVPIANPGSLVDLQVTDYRGRIRAKKNGFYLFYRKDTNGGLDQTGLYRSWLDKVELSAYPFTQKEQQTITGDGVSTPVTGTLAQIDKTQSLNIKRTAHYVRVAVPVAASINISNVTKASTAVVSALAHGFSVGDQVIFEGISGMTQLNGQIGYVSVVGGPDAFAVNINTSSYGTYTSGGTVTKAEVLVDQRDGLLTGNTTGTGTINYATGMYSINLPATVGAAHAYAEYYYEDSTDADSGTANSGAPYDFSADLPRLAGQGLTLRQDAGGFQFQNVYNLYGDDYCFHLDNSYKVTISADDESEISNDPFLVKMGIPYWRAGCETSDGIIYVDATDVNDVNIRSLQLTDVSTRAKPTTISQKLDLAPYRFEKAVVFEWGQFICIACRTINSAVNDTVLLYHKIWKNWSITDYRVSCLKAFQGTLIGGDSGSNNVFSLFNGVSDEESNIPNQWVSGEDNLGAEGQKKVHRLLLAGLTGPDQEYDFQIAPDNGAFVTVYTIKGDGAYVDKGHPILIGPNILGSEELGGGGDGIEAFHYRHEFAIHTDRFEKLKYRIVANGVGFLSVSEVQFKDIRYKGRRAATKYVSEPGTEDTTGNN